MSGPPLFTWREYYALRNSLLRVLNEFGSVGPMGEMPLLDTTDLLVDVTRMLTMWPEWCVYFALTEGGLTVFHDRIRYEGALFAGASSIDELGRRCESTKREA
jgi:hypothetical protein